MSILCPYGLYKRIACVLKSSISIFCKYRQTTEYAHALRQMQQRAYPRNTERSVKMDNSSLLKELDKRLYKTLPYILVIQSIFPVYGGVALLNEKIKGLIWVGLWEISIHHKTRTQLGCSQCGIIRKKVYYPTRNNSKSFLYSITYPKKFFKNHSILLICI